MRHAIRAWITKTPRKQSQTATIVVSFTRSLTRNMLGRIAMNFALSVYLKFISWSHGVHADKTLAALLMLQTHGTSIPKINPVRNN